MSRPDQTERRFDMSLIPWRRREVDEDLPVFRPITSLWEDMDRLFGRTFGEDVLGRRGWAPALDMDEDEKEVTIRAEIPGVKPEDLDVSVTENTLSIAGEKKEEHERKERGFFRSERRYGSFRRTVPLPVGVDPDSVTAEYNDGILSVRLQKTEQAQPKRIQVKPGQRSLEHQEAAGK
jgi:HSP20 family protein